MQIIIKNIVKYAYSNIIMFTVEWLYTLKYLILMIHVFKPFFFFIQIHQIQYMPFQYNSWYKNIVIILLCLCPLDGHANWLDLSVYFHIQHIYMYLYKGDLASHKSTFFSEVSSLNCIHRILRKEWHQELQVVSSMWLIVDFLLYFIHDHLDWKCYLEFLLEGNTYI